METARIRNPSGCFILFNGLNFETSKSKLNFFYLRNRQNVFLYAEFDFVISKPHAVNSCGIVLIGRSGVVGKTFL